MLTLKRTNSENPDFKVLVKKLDAYLAITDGDEHAFYDQFNQIDTIKEVVMAYHNEKPVGCGAIKEYDEVTTEIKRMFSEPKYRGQGVASSVLEELEKWTKELGYSRCILETGIRQKEAVILYQKNAYRLIPNYGQYKEKKDSRCFEKRLVNG